MTKDIIQEMLKENTGKSMMDSGDHYGRNWQINQDRDFSKEPQIAIKKDGEYIQFRKNLYHFLTEHLEYNDAMTKEFLKFSENDESYFYNMKKFAEIKHDGKDPTKPICDNSYNFESLLDQDIQFIIFSNQEIDYCLLEIHGGCDIRGGYTEPKVFEFIHGWEDFYVGMTDLYGNCKCQDWSGLYWQDDQRPQTWKFNAEKNNIICDQCLESVRFY